jgi:hypothetical protein
MVSISSARRIVPDRRTTMPRLSAANGAELAAFWRAHLEGWRLSELNQREYCEVYGLPLKRFGNWRSRFRHESAGREGKLLYRRGGGLEHRLKHGLKEFRRRPRATSLPADRANSGGRRNFSLVDKRRMVDEEACRKRASVSGKQNAAPSGSQLAVMLFSAGDAPPSS